MRSGIRMVFGWIISGLIVTHTATAGLTNRYVVKGNPSAFPPYDSPINAAADIQTAINYARAGETVLVAAATYDSGGLTNWPAGTLLTNRVVITNSITLRSLDNDPGTTIIQGAWDPVTTNGPAAVRCVYLAYNAKLIGFTVTGGATLADKDSPRGSGGGIYCPTTGGWVSNCVVTGNQAVYFGGGIYRGRVFNTAFSGNRALQSGGGAGEGVLSQCTFTSNSCPDNNGGAGWNITADHCTFSYNRARSGAVSFGGTFYNCLMFGNQAALTGGALIAGSGVPYNLRSCTVIGNQAWSGGGATIDPNRTVRIYNSIVYSNHARSGDVTADNLTLGGNLYITNSCTWPDVPGWADGNITNAPRLRHYGVGYGTNHVAGDYRLRMGSPCVDTGLNDEGWMDTAVDLDGQARIYNGTVDMGAYEMIPRGTLLTIQ